MNYFGDNEPSAPPEDHDSALPAVSVDVSPAVSPLPPPRVYPADLQISWSWLHLLFFLLYGLVSIIVIQGTLALYYAPKQRGLTTKQLEDYLISKPQFAIGSMLLWYAALFLFLYVTLAALPGRPFWATLGWHKIRPRPSGQRRHPLVYVLTGCGLSIFVAILTSRVKTPDNLPVEEFFKHRQTALLFMAMAVFVAPLVEETLFRG